MTQYISDIAFTPAVKEIQELKGSRRGYARMEENGGWQDAVSEDLAKFIATRDSFYLGTANADGQPYIQHRGGRPGFLRVLDSKTLAFADFQGNRQYISSGNLSENDKAYIFLMDYPRRRRIKIWGRAKISNDPELLKQLSDDEYGAIVDQAIVFEITAWDVNCPQHITPRFTETELAGIVEPLQRRIEELESQLQISKGKTA